MGRRSRNQSELSLEKPVPVRLTDEDRAAKAHQMAVKRQAYRAVKRDAKRYMRSAKEELERLEGEIDQLADALIADEELRAQGDLRFEGKTEATQVLAQVEARAPLPSEPHAYISPAASGGAGGDALPCDLCGSSEADPIHVVPAHTFVGDGSGEGRCRACARDRSDAVHGTESAAGMESANTPTNETGAIAEETFVCADCTDSGAAPEASTHPKSEGVWIDKDARIVCSNCRQVAIEAGRWPHQFGADPKLRRKRGKEPLCIHCELPAAHDVHQVGEVVAAEMPAVVDTDTTPGDTSPVASVEIAKERVLDPAYDFDESEPAPAVVSTHKAIEDVDGADDGTVGGEA